MKLIPNLPKIALIVLAVNLLMLCGCNRNKQNPGSQAKQMQTSEQSEKVPGDLENIENNIEKIIKGLEGPSVSLKDEKKQEGDKSQEEQKSGENQGQEGGGQNQDQKQGQQGGGENQDQKQGQQGNQNNQAQQSPQPNNQNAASTQKDPWKEIAPTINNLHYQWNSYQPSATKKNANRELIDNFSNALNNLTSNIIAKDKNNTLLAANNLYSYIPDFYMLYRTGTSPEIKRIRYYARNALLSATVSNWDQAGKDVGSLKSTWAIYKNTIDPKNQELASKLDYSIYELEKVVTAKNVSLADIKGRIAMSNTASLEKALKENKEK